MILLTPSQRARLLANGRMPDADHIPVVKFFNPFGQGTWLATELDEDGDILFGLADLGYPELGSWSLTEMAAIRLPFGLGIERDLHFEGRFPICMRRLRPIDFARFRWVTRLREGHRLQMEVLHGGWWGWVYRAV